MEQQRHMGHEILYSALLRLLKLLEVSLQPDFPDAQVSLSDFTRSASWQADVSHLYLIPHQVVLNEQGLRPETTRERYTDEEGEERYRFYRAPLPLTLHVLLVPSTSRSEEHLKLVGRLYQLLDEQPTLSLESSEQGQDPALRISLAADTRLTSEQLVALFQAGHTVPRLSVPCLIRCLMRSEQILREARPTRSLRGQVQRT
ncbi:MAG: Pvc16 family protein [Myxococcota bacterium]